ncbi:MAG: hypothetical protein AB2A00_37460, partial [Myxococcota bacterium]
KIGSRGLLALSRVNSRTAATIASASRSFRMDNPERMEQLTGEVIADLYGSAARKVPGAHRLPLRTGGTVAAVAGLVLVALAIPLAAVSVTGGAYIWAQERGGQQIETQVFSPLLVGVEISSLLGLALAVALAGVGALTIAGGIGTVVWSLFAPGES